MKSCALRTLGVSFLLAQLAGTATMADAATHKKAHSHIVVARSHATSAGGRVAHARRRGHRAPPAGGVYARNAILIDPSTGQVLFEKSSSSQVPIASCRHRRTCRGPRRCS